MAELDLGKLEVIVSLVEEQRRANDLKELELRLKQDEEANRRQLVKQLEELIPAVMLEIEASENVNISTRLLLSSLPEVTDALQSWLVYVVDYLNRIRDILLARGDDRDRARQRLEAMPPDPDISDRVESLQRQLMTVERNLNHWQEQKALHGNEPPVKLLNDIEQGEHDTARLRRQIEQLNSLR